VVRLRALEDAAVLRRIAKGTEFRPQEWKAEGNEEVWFCACKRSQHQPLCDGSHKTLPA
jgi:CDGSH-type Zn-finger protein